MKRSKLNRWLADLRSGKYSQATEFLLSEDKTCGCCLGVYLDGSGLPPVKTDLFRNGDEDISGWAWYDGDLRDGVPVYNGTCLPDKVAAEDGWHSDVGTCEKDGMAGFETSKGLMICLTEANDAGVPFTEIADIVEANPLWFFNTIEEDVQAH